MNAQRWIALGLLVSALACALSSGFWLPAVFGEEDEDEAAEEPTATQQLAELEQTATPRPGILAQATEEPTPTPNPLFQELLNELEMEKMGIGDDPFIVRAGDFTTIDAVHRGEGTASVYRVQEGQFVLRLEPFNVTNGPDLHVILSQAAVPRTSADTLLPSHVDLGALEATSGVQNYRIPAEINLDSYQSVAIYSLSLNLVYTSAELVTVRGGGQ